jgi:hypothetical protein
MCKHEFDARYQKSEDKLYIAQLYFPLIGQVQSLFLFDVFNEQIEKSMCLISHTQFAIYVLIDF